MNKLTIKTAKVKDLFKDAIAKNDDQTQVISMSEKLANNINVMGMDVPIKPNRKDLEGIINTMEEEVQNNSPSAPTVELDIQMVREDIVRLLKTGISLDTEKSTYYLDVSDDGVFKVKHQDHFDYDRKADNSILEIETDESSIAHRIVTIKTA